ncbi:hypothetical protein FF100_27435 [Methylobacterium terricola]|uniref:Uncharacterized protein n=1 Tax=Methylobacterium terricola TaxID=2583531 RepID=A0A5C4L944_9HYPH|nr:hypothetical protein [Methylobacterium terricola]TNC09040.1 hypothetical protein FF100_27435 [Methylobacterium terricola]
MTWLTDVGAYRQAYIEAVQSANAPNVLHPQFLADLSIPQAVAVHPSYFESETRLLVMGQETLRNTIPLAQADPYRAWGQLDGNDIAAHYAAGGPFWNAFNLFCARFGRAGNLSVAWSNLCKSQLRTPINNSVAVRHHPNCDFDAYAAWQFNLFHEEMKFLAPHGVLLFIGVNHGPNWYEELLYSMYPNAHMSDFGIDGVRVWTLPDMEFDCVSAKHPAGRPPDVCMNSAKNATFALMRLLKQRGHNVSLPADSWSTRLRDLTASTLVELTALSVGVRLKNVDGRFAKIVAPVQGWPNPIVLEDCYSGACSSYPTVEALIEDGWVLDE